MSGTVSDFDQLVSMGFPPEKVERALKATGGLQTAMDWLLAHPGDLDAPAGGQSLGGRPNLETGAPASGPEGKAVEEDEGEIVDGEQTAKSLQCNDCQKLFRDSSAAERHAAKSGHVNFSESTTAIKPLTPEEKAAKLAEIKQRLAEKREQRLLTEEEEARNREKIRRKSGKELIDIKEKLETREMEKALTLKKKEKDEEKKAKAKIKAQIEADKRERIAKREATKQAHLEQQAAEAASTSTSEIKKEYTETRLQIRQMSGGAPLTHTFQASDTLKTVYEYVGQHVDGAFKLMITFPRKVLERDSFDDKTLKELDLVPSGILMVTL